MNTFGVILAAAWVAAGAVRADVKVYHGEVKAHWQEDSFWYRNDLPGGGKEFVAVNCLAGKRQRLFDQTRLAQRFSAVLGRAVDSDHLPFDSVEMGPDGVILDGGRRRWQLDWSTYALTELPPLSATPIDLTPRASAHSGEPVEMRWVNRLSETVDLYWMDYDGDPIYYAELPAQAAHVQPTFGGHVWVVADRSNHVLDVVEAAPELRNVTVADWMKGRGPIYKKLSRPKGPPDTRSPDHRWLAFAKHDQLWLRELATGKELQLSNDGSVSDTYRWDPNRMLLLGAAPPRGVTGSTAKLLWSADSKHLIATRTHVGTERNIYLIDASPPGQVEPRVVPWRYLKPGDDVPVAEPHLFDVAQQREVAIDRSLWPRPFAISDPHWLPGGSEFYVEDNERGHQHYRVLAINASSGDIRTITDEHSDTFIAYTGSHHYLRLLPKAGEMLWMSERDGWNHLYRYDLITGEVLNQVTAGDWAVTSIAAVNEAAQRIWFWAGGSVRGQDPYYEQFYRVNFDGTGLVALTAGDGTHSVQWSPNRRYLLDTWSRVDLPPVTVLRRASDGGEICALEQGDAHEVLAEEGSYPERFVAKGRDGVTDIYGVIIWPAGHRTEAHYPVVEDIYAGPQGHFVPKAFGLVDLHTQELLRRGIVVVHIDGMGTDGRSKAFHEVCWKNLADAGFPDRILWLKAAARLHPEMDLSRLGIIGTSAGGQSAMAALLWHGDFYKVAVADSGCHDNRMDKIWWNEQWMGWPIGPQYAANSNVVNAARLQGKLLLMAGQMDRNVDPQTTMQVVNALVRANKPFEMLIMPGVGHGVVGTRYGWERARDFLVKNLTPAP